MFGIGHGFRWLQPFYDGEGGGGGGGSDVQSLPEVPSPSDADLDALAGDDDDGDAGESDAVTEEEGDEDEKIEREKPTPKAKKEPAEVDEGDEDEDKEEAEKPAAKAEDDEDKVAAKDDLASIKALKADYPDIFKKHPALRVAIAEHRQFRDMFSSVDEAKEATQAQSNLADLREQVLDKTDFGFLLDELNRADGPATARLVRKILPAVLERSKDLYYEITEEPITQFVHAAYTRAQRNNDKNLMHSAMYMWRFLGKDGNPSPQKAGPSEADRQFEQRVQEFEEKKLQDASGTVNTSIRTGLVGLIERAIDPNGSLKETTKKALVDQLVRDIDQEVASDSNHMTRVQRLWANARRSSYAQGHTSRIISAYLERAKQLLPKHARKVREELNISDSRPNGGERSPRPVQRREQGPAARPNGGSQASPKTIRDTNPRSIDWNRTSDEDILSGKARLRK
jgi:hypothetical protein